MAAPSTTVDEAQVLAAALAFDEHRRHDRNARDCASCAHRSFPCHRRQSAERVLAAAGRTAIGAAA